MRNLVKATIALCKRFVRAREAVAAVEFALILPIMLTVYLGAIETTQAISVDRKVTLVSAALGDLVARVQKSTSKTQIATFFSLTKTMVRPNSGTPLNQVVSMVHLKDGVAKVRWSEANGPSAAERAVDSVFPLDSGDKIKTLVTDGYLVVSEVSYAHTPLLGLFFKTSFNLSHRSVYLPRFGSEITCPTC